MIQATTRQQLTARLDREQSGQRLPSVAAALVSGGGLGWAARAGSAGVTGAPAGGDGADIQYRAGSITKTFVAAAVMRLRDAGRLRLTDPAGEHLPGAGHAAGATIAQLLSHTSGLRAETAGPWWERTAGGSFTELAAGSLGPGALRWRPGRRFHYSNVGYALLGELVSRAHGLPWPEVIYTELLVPLGMSRTTTRPQPPCARGLAVHPHADLVLPEPEHDAGAMAPAGQLWTTTGDLAAWARFLAGDTGGLLAADTLAEMREPHAVDDRPGQPWDSGYGLGLQLWNSGGRRFYGHSGSMPGFVAILQIEAGNSDAVIAAANSTAGFSPQFADDLQAIADAGERGPAAAWSPAGPGPAVPGGGLDGLLGTWYWGPVPYTLSQDGPLLTLAQTGRADRSSRFRPEPGGTWTGLDGYHAGEPLAAVRDQAGRVRWLDLGSFVYTRTPYDPAAEVPGGVDPGGWRPLAGDEGPGQH